MFLRRRPRARQVHVNLPRGRQIQVTVPKTPWTRQPARRPWARPEIIGAAIAGLGAAIAFMTGRIRKRQADGGDGQLHSAPPAPASTAATGQGSVSVTPAQPTTSDREPDEIDRLAGVESEPNSRAASPRR